MFKKTRRIISGINEAQISTVLTDEAVSTITPYTLFPSFQLQDLFYTEDKPQSLTTRHLDKPYNIELPEGAIRFIKMRMPTKAEITAEFQQLNHPIPEDWTKFNLHNTDSVDYIYILSGSITYVTGEEQIKLQEGNFLAQIGPEHTWVNDNDEPCYILCVMVGTKPSNSVKKMKVE